MSGIDQLIINSPYEEPNCHWHYDASTRKFQLLQGRRSAGYVIASQNSNEFDEPGVFIDIPLVNKIRTLVKTWRNSDYEGATSITKRLLNHWNTPSEFDVRRFFYCQLEAVETIIYLTEIHRLETGGVEIPSDGGMIQRLCAKMATGTGKTLVMAMLIAWQVLNHHNKPRDSRFTKNVLIVTPGLTVRDRLSVLVPSYEANYYKAFRVIPTGLIDRFNIARVKICNWHRLNWETAERVGKKKSVDKRGPLSDRAYVRSVLGSELSHARRILVINDEAHHAWRIPNEGSLKGVQRDELEKATKWVGGLDRIDRTIGINVCYDFSATPFISSGKTASQVALFKWIVSDFGLNDAIESGLVKTPRIVVRDDARVDSKTFRSRLYHLYGDPDVKADLTRRAREEEPLPDLVTNAYYLLSHDWSMTKQVWSDQQAATPPVMISVANRTETAARIKHAFDHKHILVEQLCDRTKTLHIDSKVLANAEAAVDNEASPASTKSRKSREAAEHLRTLVNTVGIEGKPGEQIQHVIAVDMLSEGWDAKTVTHIMGLRAFSSQLLCEQVVGRGLRRTSYELNEKGYLDPEYVNIFGVPFAFLPHEGTPDTPPPPDKSTTEIKVLEDRKEFEISWPNIVRIDRELRPTLSIDLQHVPILTLNALDVAFSAKVAPMLDGSLDEARADEIRLEKLSQQYRLQKIIFETGSRLFDDLKQNWTGGKPLLLAQLVGIVDQCVNADLIQVHPKRFNEVERLRNLVIALNMTSVIHHLRQSIVFKNTERRVPIFDTNHPIGSTSDMPSWFTRKTNEKILSSHINRCVYDSTWETSDAHVLDRSPLVYAWAKNDHLGFEVEYVFGGVVRKYRPDFLVRLTDGKMLVLETKGEVTPIAETKFQYLKDWVEAVNTHGGFGHWCCEMSTGPGKLERELDRIVNT